MKRNHLWLWLVILIAWSVRLTLLGYQSLWYDEGVTWLLSQMSPLNLIRWTAADIQPPLYYLLVWLAARLFGPSEWALRFPSALFGLLAAPLLYLLARRLFSISTPYLSVLPLLAAGLMAISPVMVYYSQEARMYTLLVCEATLASYLLLKVLDSEVTGQSSGLFSLDSTTFAYALSAIAALYTHYFAVFLLAAHALYALVILWQRGWTMALLRLLLQILAIVALLFGPWLWVLLARWSDDPSYWPGALKLHEALRQVFITFTVGETVFEQTGLRLALSYLLLLVLAAVYGRLAHHTAAPTTPQPISSLQPPASSVHPLSSTLFLLLWLLLPVLFILALSYQSPKFNPRYTLLAWPAFALVLAAALARLLPARTTFCPPGIPTQLISMLPFLCAVFFVLATATFSLYNWFTDRRFAKDDFQALAQFVRERKAPDERVLLSSGHMFPVWAYYYGWQGWTPLPKMERLDVQQVTDLSIASNLDQALPAKGGVWLVSWQDEVIDPNGVVPFWLDRLGQQPQDAGDFQGVRLEHWRLDPSKRQRLRQSPIQFPAQRFNQAESSSFNFANQVELLGLTQLDDHELVLFWQPRQPLPDDLLVTFSLNDQDGFTWVESTSVGRPGAYLYPPSRWPIGQTVMTRHRLNWLPGTPPGLYLAEVGLGQAGRLSNQFSGWDILDKQGRPLRRTALLEPVNLSHLAQPGHHRLPLSPTPLVDFSPIISLRYSQLSSSQAEPGDRLLLTLLWQAGPFNSDDISVAFELVDAAGASFHVGSALTPSRNFNLPRWQPGDIVRGQYWLNLPPEASPGAAALQVRLIHVHSPAYDRLFPLVPLEILPAERSFTLPVAPAMPLEANFANLVTLVGADCRAASRPRCQAGPGESVTLTLYWRAAARFETNYTIFTHLLGPDETVLVNADHAPPQPTQGWVPGQIITDQVTFTLPADLPPGDYPLEVGLYHAADPAFPRLALSTGEQRLILPQSLKVE
jgi:uncharacterized membrane protein